MSLAHSPRIITRGLLLCLDAGDPKSYAGSGTTWHDRSGNDYNATVESSVSYSSAHGGGLTTLNDLLNTNQSIYGSFSCSSEDYTWEIWLTDNGSQGSDPSAFGVKDVGGITSNGFRAQPNMQQWVNGSLELTNYSVPTSTPTQIVLRRSGTSFKSFVNAELDSTKTGPSDYATFISYGLNDRSHTGSNNGWNGTYYIVRMYNVALSDDEITQNFSATKSRFGL